MLRITRSKIDDRGRILQRGRTLNSRIEAICADIGIYEQRGFLFDLGYFFKVSSNGLREIFFPTFVRLNRVSYEETIFSYRTLLKKNIFQSIFTFTFYENVTIDTYCLLIRSTKTFGAPNHGLYWKINYISRFLCWKIFFSFFLRYQERRMVCFIASVSPETCAKTHCLQCLMRFSNFYFNTIE